MNKGKITKIICEKCGKIFYADGRRKICDGCRKKNNTSRTYMEKDNGLNEGKNYEEYLINYKAPRRTI